MPTVPVHRVDIANLVIDVFIHLDAGSVFGPLSGQECEQRSHLGGLQNTQNVLLMVLTLITTYYL